MPRECSWSVDKAVASEINRSAIGRNGVHEQAGLLPTAAHGPSLAKDLAGLAHPSAKVSQFGPDRRPLQVRQHLMTVSHVVEVAERSVEDRREIELFASGAHRGKDLVEVEVDREPVVYELRGPRTRTGCVQDRRRHASCSGSRSVKAISLLSADWCRSDGATVQVL